MAAPPCCSTCSAAILKSTDRRRLSSVCQVLQTFKELILDHYSVEELTHFGFDDPKSVICKTCFGKLESLVHTRIKAQELKQFLLDKIEAFGERLGLQKKRVVVNVPSTHLTSR